MQKNVLCWMTTQVLVSFGLFSASGAMQPATVDQNPDSFAMKLHYPAKEKAEKTQGAVKTTARSDLTGSRLIFRL